MSATATSVALRDVHAGCGQREVLADITTVLPRARITALVGANGAGKSTLLNVIAGVQTIRTGTLLRTGTRLPAYATQHSEVSGTLPVTVRDCGHGPLGTPRTLAQAHCP